MKFYDVFVLKNDFLKLWLLSYLDQVFFEHFNLILVGLQIILE